MALADVEAEVLTPMQQIYLPPRDMPKEAQAGALRGYAAALQEFSRDDLRNAWGNVVASHVTRAWPVPGIIVKAARDARKERNEASGMRARSGEQGPSQEELWNRWVAIRGTTMAKKAAVEGYAWSLKCEVLYNKKKTEEIDARELLAAHNRALTLHQKLLSGEMTLMRAGKRFIKFSVDDREPREIALDMYRNLQLREAETAQEIFS